MTGPNVKEPVAEKALPRSSLVTRWVSASVLGGFIYKAQKEHERAIKGPGWNPKIVKVRNDIAILDTAGSRVNSSVVGWVLIAKLSDHPFLSYLNKQPHIPRTVKALYRKEVRLSQFRTKEAMHTISQIDLAHNAYEKYRINYGR